MPCHNTINFMTKTKMYESFRYVLSSSGATCSRHNKHIGIATIVGAIGAAALVWKRFRERLRKPRMSQLSVNEVALLVLGPPRLPPHLNMLKFQHIVLFRLSDFIF